MDLVIAPEIHTLSPMHFFKITFRMYTQFSTSISYVIQTFSLLTT